MKRCLWSLMCAMFVIFGCQYERSTAPPPQSAPPAQGYPPPVQGYPPPAAAQPTPPGPEQQMPGQRPAVSGGPPAAQYFDLQWLRSQASGALGELIGVLPNNYLGRVRGIPMLFDPTPGAVNAFAACSDQGAVMAITDGMLEISAYLAQAQANDEVFGTRKVDEYIAFLAKTQRPNTPLSRPAPGFFNPAQEADPRRAERAYQVLGELLAFVLGHELAHHYLGHLPCTGGAGLLGSGELARALSSTVPIFNQPNELAADAAGTNNVLVAGARRSGYQWTEGGGLLTMRFFAGLDQLTPIDILFGFERTHPPPGLRTPVIQQTANAWRLTGRGWLPIPRLGRFRWTEDGYRLAAHSVIRTR